MSLCEEGESVPWELCVSVKCERVKEEPGLEQRSWSSACAAEDEAGGQTECGVSAAAARAGLYAAHEVKGELVLGPTALQPPDSAFAPAVPIKYEETITSHAINACSQSPVEDPQPGASFSRHRLRGCSVRLELLPVREQPNRQTLSRTPPQTHSALMYNRGEITSQTKNGCDRSPEAGPRPGASRGQLGLRACSVRLERLPPRDQTNSRVLAATATQPTHTVSGKNAERRGSPAAEGRDPGPAGGPPRTHSRKKQYQCDTCLKQFSLKCNLIAHIRIHTGEKPHECKICLKQFSRSDRLNVHKRIHIGEKPFECGICHKQFSDKSNVNRHEYSHAGKKAYECDTCLKQFSQRSRLITHKRFHTGEKPYKCEICQKQFSDKSTLNVHKRIHTGEKPYKCDICLKQFSNSSHLKAHKRIHTGEKPYKCEFCLKQFSFDNSLRVHKCINKKKNP